VGLRREGYVVGEEWGEGGEHHAEGVVITN